MKKFRSLRYGYHEGQLMSFMLDPQGRLSMAVDLAPLWNEETLSANVVLSGIENYAEVASFFQKLPKPSRPADPIAEILALQYVGEGPNWVDIDLINLGGVRIKSRRVTES